MNETEILIRKLAHKLRTPLGSAGMLLGAAKSIIKDDESTINELIDRAKLNIGLCCWYLNLLETEAMEVVKENFPLSKCSIGPILLEALEKYLRLHYNEPRNSDTY